MKFEDENKIVYVKDYFNKKLKDLDDLGYYNTLLYYKGYLVHRRDGPAIEYGEGSKHWLINGKYHREDGPAQEWSNGDKYYCLNGVFISMSEHEKIMNINKKQIILESIL